jgi:PAS domain S-box-containing protein
MIREILRRAFQASPDAHLVVDEDGAIMFVNRQAEVLFGYDASEVVGTPVEILVPRRHRAAHISYRQGYEAEPRSRAMGEGMALTAVRRDGSEFPVEVSLAPTRFGDWTLVIASVRDVTEKRRLAATFPHQLRTPIAEITGLADELATIDGAPAAIVEAIRSACPRGSRRARPRRPGRPERRRSDSRPVQLRDAPPKSHANRNQ